MGRTVQLWSGVPARMKILWVKSDLLHPTTKGGHIRTLEMPYTSDRIWRAIHEGGAPAG